MLSLFFKFPPQLLSSPAEAGGLRSPPTATGVYCQNQAENIFIIFVDFHIQKLLCEQQFSFFFCFMNNFLIALFLFFPSLLVYSKRLELLFEMTRTIALFCTSLIQLFTLIPSHFMLFPVLLENIRVSAQLDWPLCCCCNSWQQQLLFGGGGGGGRRRELSRHTAA